MHAVIFDIDGTLLQSVAVDHELYQQAVRHLLPNARMRPAIADYDYVSDSGILSQVFSDNGLDADVDLATAIQARFVKLLDRHITHSGAFLEIPGALDYLHYHIESADHAVAYATGGWRASALLKLNAAGFGHLDVPLATADDALDRKDIMLTALSHLGGSFSSITYYGDGSWDRDSSQQLGWNFVPVGAELGGLESYRDLIR